jgi:hypothetical protein
MTKTVTAMLLALVLPGAGHVFLGKRVRGAAFFGIVAFMFLTGLAVDGGIYTGAASRGALLTLLASYGSMGSGAFYFLANAFGPPGDVMSPTFEYGTTFTLTAGLMNLLLVLDCFDIGRERKS